MGLSSDGGMRCAYSKSACAVCVVRHKGAGQPMPPQSLVRACKALAAMAQRCVRRAR